MTLTIKQDMYKDLTEVKKILSQRYLFDLYILLENNKVLSLEDIQKHFSDKTPEMLLMDLGALECLGFIMVKLGNPLKFICVRMDDGLYRYNRRFPRENNKENNK